MAGAAVTPRELSHREPVASVMVDRQALWIYPQGAGTRPVRRRPPRADFAQTRSSPGPKSLRP
jgi:hypothetical protein